ncbi:MAG: hypothetical protein HY854_22780 [Burkholderiales bacterium]|nr:hypothetical protein [Burkholderiales bacterium]
MPQMTPQTQQDAVPPFVPASAATAADDAECAFGCECADPQLQIDGWAEPQSVAEPH